MIFPDVTIKEWLKKYPDLDEPDYSHSCSECGVKIKEYKPFIEKDWIGFVSNKCDCGCGFHVFNDIPNSEESFNLLKKSFQEYLQ